jgi:hypothetical protein
MPLGSAHNIFETCKECDPPRGLSGPQIARKAAGRRTSLCLTVNCYQRFRDLNLSSMRRFVPACVKAWKYAQIIPSTAEQENGRGPAVQFCSRKTEVPMRLVLRLVLNLVLRLGSQEVCGSRLLHLLTGSGTMLAPRAGNSAANIAHPETRGMLPKAPLYHRSRGTTFVSLSNVRRAYYR